jgi:single-strand DNA-binding protein
MASYNHVVLVGNLTRDPELKFLPSGTALCEFAIAVNRRWTDAKTSEKKEEVSFFDCVVWAKGAEIFAKYMTKGKPCLIDGELRQERWEDKDGGKRSRVKINVQNFQFLGGKRDEDGPPSAGAPPADDFDSDIPF